MVQFKLTADQMNGILRNSGYNIVVDMRDWACVDVCVAAGLFEGVDKTAIIAAKGSLTVRTKTLWDNSGGTRLISVRDVLMLIISDPNTVSKKSCPTYS
jgi:hypothetical protein